MVKKLVLEKADRLYHLPPVLDDFLPRKARKKMLGREIVDLARFSWPTATPAKIDGADIRSATPKELGQLAEKTAAWYKARYGGRINPDKEIFIGGSIRQILNLLALAYFNPGDMILTPDPGVWHYRAAAVLASAETVPYHLNERNHFKPTVSAISNNIARTARGMILNSPHNPTGVALDKDDLSEILHLAGRENVLLILDQAFDGFLDSERSASLFSLPGGRKTAVELYSFAYNFGHPLPACAFAIAQPAIVAALNRLALIFGIGISQFQVMQAMAACDEVGQEIEPLKKIYLQNRKMVDQLCDKLRLFPGKERVGPFYWAKLPGRKQSRRYARTLYIKAGILTVPGFAFGENGEGYLRFSLTAPPESYSKALKSTRKLFQASRAEDKTDGQN